MIFVSYNLIAFFLYVGIHESIQANVMHETQLLFNSSAALKDSVRRQPNNSRGYDDNEFTKQLKDAKELFDIGQNVYTNLSFKATQNQLLDGENYWPSAEILPNFRSTVEEFYNECTKLSALLLRVILSNLNCSAVEDIPQHFIQHTSFLRLNYYPIIEVEHEQIEICQVTDPDPICQQHNNPRKFGVSRHTDSGVLTVLMQGEQAGLEVYSGTKEDRKDGEWVSVPPVPGGLTINTGDMLQVQQLLVQYSKIC